MSQILFTKLPLSVFSPNRKRLFHFLSWPPSSYSRRHTTATAVVDRNLSLRPPSPTHCRPSQPRLWPDFPGIPEVQLFLSQLPLLLVAATSVVDRSLHLRLPFPTQRRPPHPDRDLTSLAFPEVQPSSPGRPLLLAAAAPADSVVADRSLSLRPLSLTYRCPPPTGLQPDFPGVSQIQLFLSRPPSSSGRGRRRCSRSKPSSLTTVPDPSPSSSTQTAA